MAEKIKIEKNTIAETLLLPLSGRADCSKKYPEIFKDEEAERIISTIDYDFSSLSYKSFVVLSWAVRKHFLLGCAKKYLREHPNATIVNLGCGADTCFSELDNGTCRILNLDLPEVIEARQQFTKCHEREKNVGASAFDLSWLDKVETKPEDGLFVMSGGVLFYFEEEKIRMLFTALSQKFPNGGICFDAVNSKGLKKSNAVVEKSGNKGAKIVFALNDAEKQFVSWSPHFKVNVQRSLSQEIKKAKSIPFGTRFAVNMGMKMGFMQFVEVLFK
ncbi:class I SAM-dependent methyltransferase [Treponema sp.]|uniref:class I SAM-dependent methyltransferase n=1 Tax=Treponema sp. TaxID=166 RepID=UPI0038905589